MNAPTRPLLRLLAIPAALAAMPVALAVSHHPRPVLDIDTQPAHVSAAQLVGANHDPVRYEPPATIVEPAQADALKADADAQQSRHGRAPRTSHEAVSPPLGGRSAGGSLGTGACGGDLPPCYVMMRESGGSLTAVNPSSGAAGKWQMLRSTSQALGYPLPMNQYPESVQDEAARKLYAGGAGCSAWVTC